MQPYSELANWDGSLELVVDSLGPPSPSETSMYDQYPKFMSSQSQSNQQNNLSAAAVHSSSHISTSTTSTTSNALFPLPPSAAEQESSSSSSATAVVLSPQEREIMADITLDPDDPDPDPDPSGATSATSSGAWAWSALGPTVKNGNNDASWGAPAPTQQRNPQKSRSPFVTTVAPIVAYPITTTTASQYSIVPAPPPVGLGVASTSVSVSPSPFAPPPASAPIAGPVSQSLPFPSSSSSSHLTAKAESPDIVRVHPAGSEYVMKHTSASTLHRDDGEAGPGGNSNAGHLDACMHDPPDQPQPRASSRQSPVLTLLDTTNLSSSSRSPPRHSPKTPLFLPSPSESDPPSRPPSDALPPEESDPSDVISIDAPSPSPSPPPMRLLRRHNTQIKSKTNKQGRQLMAYVLVPPLPSAVRKSDYVPLGKSLHMREHRVAVKTKAPIGDNASSSALVAALQGAFENNSIGEGSTKTAGARRKREKTKAVVPVEVVEVVDSEDEGEDKGELRNKGSNNLARALSSAFAHNSADPKVAARPAAEAKGRTHQLRRSTHTGNSSANVEVIVPPLPPKRSRPRLRARVTSDADDSNTISSRRRNEKRQPQTPTSPQKKKRRRLARRGDGDDVDEHEGEEEEEEEEIEIVDRVSRQLPRCASRTKPLSFSKAERPDPSQSKLSRSSKQRRTSTPSPAPISTRTSLPSPSPLPPPESPTASPPNTNSLAGLPLTILPAPAATDIVIPPRALNHLHASPGPPDPKFETRHQEFVQGFHFEEAAIGAHGLLESPSVVAATTSAVSTTTTMTAISITTPIDSSIRASLTSPQNPPIDLGLGVIVPMDVTDGEQEQMQGPQDAIQASVVPPHALRISSSTHPDGPMLGFVLSEHDDVRCTTSLSADTEASSDGIGLELGAETTLNMEFMPLDAMDHNSVFNADPGWVGWHATAPSTGLVVENEFVGDGTIDPSVLGGPECSGAGLGGGSPNKAVFRSDDYICSHGNSLFTRTRDNGKSDSDELGDEGDVMGLLFENSTDDSTASRPFSARGAGGKGKDKDTAVDGADARQINTGIDTRSGARKRRKSWRKALADKNDNMDHCEDTDTESHDTVARSYLSSVSNNLSSSVTTSFCHHCRRKTFRPKMCCTRIKESGNQCGKLYCDHCIQKRYPSLIFDEFATSFSCPCCGNFCNCTQCARGRGETYIPERNGGWRRWAALFPVAAAAASSGLTSPSRKKASRSVVDSAEPGLNGTRAETALTAQECLKADDTMRIVPAEPAATAPLPLPPPHSPSNTLISSPHLHVHPIPATSTATTKSVVDKKSRRHVYIGKWQKSWGLLVVPDPDPGPGRGLGRDLRKRKRAVCERLYIGSKQPLLLSQDPAKKRARKNSKKRKGRKKMEKKMEKNGQRQIALSSPPSRSSSIAADDDGANQNVALYEEHVPDPDADFDVAMGCWPGEYGHVHSHDGDVTFVPPGVTDSGVFGTTIPQEELERAIGAAFAAGMQC